MKDPTDRENEVCNEYIEYLAKASLIFCKRFEDEIGASTLIDLTTYGTLYFAVASQKASKYSEADVHENVNDIWSDLTNRNFLK